MSHTHAGANINSRLDGKPGAELIAPYLEHLAAQVGDAFVEARSTATGLGHVRLRPLLARGEPGPLGCRGGALRVRLQPRRGPRTTRCSSARATDDARPDGPRDAVQLRLPSDDPRVGEPAAVAGLHRRRARGARGARSGARPLPAGRLGRARATRRLRRRDGRRRSQRPPARPRGGGGARGLPPPGTRFVYTGIVASGANLGTWEYRPCEPEHARRRSPGGRADRASSSTARRTSASSRACPVRRPIRRRSARRRSAGSSCAPRSGTARRTRCRSGPWRLGEALLVARGERAVLRLPDRATTALRRHPAPRPHVTNGGGRLPAAARDLRQRAATRSSSPRTRRAASSSRSRLPREALEELRIAQDGGAPPGA